MAARKKKFGKGSEDTSSADLNELRKSIEREKKLVQDERKKIENLLSSYRRHAYRSTDDPEELKAHLVFNEAQYAALGQYDEDIINDKEREIVGLRKSRAKGDEIGALISRNSELEHQLEEERRKYEVMESGYKAVRQYLDDGTGFRGSKELQMEVERLERELKTMTDERNFYQDMANDYSQLQDEYQDQRIQLERLMSTSADGNADVAQQSMRMEGRAVEEKGADARGNTELKKYREMTRQLLQAAEQHSEQLKEEIGRAHV